MAPADDDDGDSGFGALHDQSAALYARVPPSQHAYASASYWRGRYEAEQRAGATQPYDWYDVTWSDFLDAAGVHLPNGSVVIHLGCGTSAWGAQLARAGCVLLDTDIDAALLASSRRRVGDTAPGQLCFAAVDALNPGVRPGCACCVLEKGTLDALRSGDDGGIERVREAVTRAMRLLRPGGVMLSVSARPKHLVECLAGMVAIRSIPVGAGSASGVLCLTPLGMPG